MQLRTLVRVEGTLMAKRVYWWITDAGYEALNRSYEDFSVGEWLDQFVPDLYSDEPVRFRVELPVTPSQHTEMEADQVLRPWRTTPQ